MAKRKRAILLKFQFLQLQKLLVSGRVSSNEIYYPYLKGNCYWRDLYFTSMFMGGRVHEVNPPFHTTCVIFFPEKVHHETQKSVPACLGVVPSCTKLAPENEGLGKARFLSCWDEGDGFFKAEFEMC